MDLESCRSGKEPVVYARANAEKGDACRADSQGNARLAVGLERRQWRICLLDVHGLDNEQVVVE